MTSHRVEMRRRHSNFEQGFSSTTKSTVQTSRSSNSTRCSVFFVEIGVSIRFYIMVLLSAISDGFDQMISVLRYRAYYLAINMFHFRPFFMMFQRFAKIL